MKLRGRERARLEGPHTWRITGFERERTAERFVCGLRRAAADDDLIESAERVHAQHALTFGTVVQRPQLRHRLRALPLLEAQMCPKPLNVPVQTSTTDLATAQVTALERRD